MENVAFTPSFPNTAVTTDSCVISHSYCFILNKIPGTFNLVVQAMRVPDQKKEKMTGF